MKVCEAAGCDRKHNSKGYCKMHYKRLMRNGAAEALKKFETPEDAIAARTKWDGDCLVWTGATNKGYGVIRTKQRNTSPHRLVWEKAYGEVPEGLVIDHICRNPVCCYLRHLRLATKKQNAEHMDLIKGDGNYRGVSRAKGGVKWRARFGHNQQSIHVGVFPTKEEALDAVVAARLTAYTRNDLDRAYQLSKETTNAAA